MTTKKEHITEEVPEDNLQRGLENRHIQLIAIGGAIGTGLFMGSGKTIAVAGPSIILVYMVIGFMLFFVMRALGELLLSNLKYKSFVDFASDLLGPWAGYFMGWTYWLCWVVTGVADVIAISGYAHFWWPNLNVWIPVLLCVSSFLVLNLVAVKMFGELEFWFSIIKIVAIVALIIIGIILMVMSGFFDYKTELGNTASLSHVWNGGNLFPKGLLGFFAGFQIAVFAFVGIELVGTTAAETKDPVKNLPKAINSIPIRVICFYVLSLIIIMSVTPWFSIDPDKSPFVQMFVLVGIGSAASIVNFVVLTSAASSANSGVFSTSRMMYGLAREKSAPRLFVRLSHRSVPANGLLFSCLCILVAYTILSQFPNVMEAFTVVTTIAAILFIFVWTLIIMSYLTYRKKRPELHLKSPYKMPGGIFMCYIELAFFVFILVLLALEPDTRIALIYSPLWFVLLSIGYWFVRKNKLKDPKTN